MARPGRTATRPTTVFIVQPNPSVTKTANPTKMTKQDDVITYTVTVANPSDRPPLHEAQTVDCLPVPFEWVSTISPASGVTVLPGPGGGCAGDRIVWDIGTVAPGDSLQLKYTAQAGGPLTAEGQYTNTVGLTGTSMPGVVAGERTYTTEKSATVTGPSLGIRKTSLPKQVTIGQTYTSVIEVDLNANVDYYSAGIVDTLPAGVDPATVSDIDITCIYPLDEPSHDMQSPGTHFHGAGRAEDRVGVRRRAGRFETAHSSRSPTHRGSTTWSATSQAVQLTNSAQPFWSTTQLPPPIDTIPGFENSTTLNKLDPVTSTVNIIEPKLSIEKKVDGSDAINATPGQEFLYTVKVTNWSDANASTAYDISVSDAVPAGVKVIEETGSPPTAGPCPWTAAQSPGPWPRWTRATAERSASRRDCNQRPRS